MASSSSTFPAPGVSCQTWTNDVFLSFRGEDTRKIFVDHLYSALKQQGIYTYKDDETLPRGESIGRTLMKAIEESQIAVIIFSKNYADSSWCLDEVAYIMKCKDTRGQIVMPIYYDVDPSEVEFWRKALVDASNLSGWELKHIANGHESKGIKQIVVEISQKLHPVTSSANQNLIGIAARMRRLRSDLQIGSGGVRMIGIWGIGGVGKTTLASCIYEEISSKFESSCFVYNIREESSRYGLGKLQEKILSEMDVNRVGGGRCLMSNRFRHRKVLIVLDDVDQLDQLRTVAGSHDWFGEGSRIIITTRDMHLLNAQQVMVHNVSLLNNEESIKLFNKHARQDYIPMKDYEQLSKEVISYAGGLPLALTVLGSFLCDKDINEWKSALVRLKEIPDTDILEKLKISFNGLKPVEKDLFLDIACFFRRRNKDDAMKMLDDCGLYPVIGVKVLVQKALISISNGVFDMHNLVQEMGHHIVRGEHPKNPEKHSRVWKKEDVLQICSMDVTTEFDLIEAIRIDIISDYQVHFPPIVANTKNLRWIEYAGEFMPRNFPQRKLCRLVLRNSLQKQLWEGYKLLPNLKTIVLWGLHNLIITPDFDGLPNLERFRLCGCRCLENIHPSIGRSESLMFLSIEDCWSLKMFPSITGLKKLENLTISLCPRLFKLSGIQQQNVDYLRHPHLDIESSTNYFVICWRCGCCNLPGVECCLEQPFLPHNNMKPYLRDNNLNHIGLRFFLKDLRSLNLSYCNLGDEEIRSAVWDLPNLKKLSLLGNGFSRLNFSLLRVPQLKLLDVSQCKGLVELLELPSSIALVKADYCDSLETFGDVSYCKWLWKVSHRWRNILGDRDVLINSMFEGNAIEDYFISISLIHQNPQGLVGRLFKGGLCTLHLPDDWYNDFWGFSICLVTQMIFSYVNIVIKREVDKDSPFELSRESNEDVEPEYNGTTSIGYVSFGSLRQTALSTSSAMIISFLVKDLNVAGCYVGAELVPRKSKGDQPQTTKVPTNFSEFWDEELDYRNPYEIQHDSNSSIKIIWRP